MESIKITAKGVISAATLLTTFYSIKELMLFISTPNYNLLYLHNRPTSTHKSFWTSITWSLIVDQLLLSLFIIQHTVMKHPSIAERLSSLHRTAYVASTALTLIVVVKYWHAVSEVALWNIDTTINLYWWIFVVFHSMCWIIVYIGSICMDINELLGTKQIYYNIQHLSDPILYKSAELRKLYTNVRHPSFICFCAVFWVVPVMSLDRLLLAVMWSAYMYLAWNTDQHDYRYQEGQFRKKFNEAKY